MPEASTLPLLSRPARGQDVIHLQSALAAAGILDGDIDGVFGPATEGALKNYQAGHDLPVNGILTAETAELLGWTQAVPPVSRLPEVTADLAAEVFGPAARPHIETNLPVVLNALAEAGLADSSMVAMALATIRVETNRFLPVSELVSVYNTSLGGSRSISTISVRVSAIKARPMVRAFAAGVSFN